MKKTWSDSLRFFVYWLCAPFHWFWRAQWLISLKPHNPCQRVLTPHEFKLSLKAAMSRLSLLVGHGSFCCTFGLWKMIYLLCTERFNNSKGFTCNMCCNLITFVHYIHSMFSNWQCSCLSATGNLVIYRHVSPNLRPQKVLCQFVFLSSGSQKIATICAMNLHLLDFNPVNAPRCASSQSPAKPGAKCRVSNPSRSRTLRQSKPNPLETASTASTARPVHVLSLSLSVVWMAGIGSGKQLSCDRLV